MHVIACLPGRTYSGLFLENWTNFLAQCAANQISITLSRRYSPNIYYARTLCLGGDLKKGQKQQPFDGKLDYDYLLWVDSDNIPTYYNLRRLINRNVDICGGVYRMEDGRFATVKEWDTTKLAVDGEMPFCKQDDLLKGSDIVPVAYTGMGFMLVKRGVMEKFPYPWFRPLQIDLGDMKDFSTEDVYFCITAQQLGFNVYIDPTVIVAHEKTFTL